MSYSIITALLLSIVALSSSTSFPTGEHNVLARFYSNFAQLYRPATLKPFSSELNHDQSLERYEFFFTEKEYSQISEESLTMLHTNIVERTITYHPTPNFEVVGTRYFYRRDLKDNDAVEIELVNSEDRLFRQVRQPNRYFYLPSFDDLEYVNQIPAMPYYEVIFICNSSFPSTSSPTQSPLLSYIDKSLQWTPRYLLDLSLSGTGKQPEMYAYADISNNGDQSFVIKGTELIAGDVKLNQRLAEYLRAGLSYGANLDNLLSAYAADSSSTSPVHHQSSGTYVYQLSVPSFITLAPRSTKSLRFFETNITVEPFLYYSSVFSTVNSHGKLFNAYNITSLNAFIPNGHLLLREQGRFVGEISLPDLTVGETNTMVFGYDADVSYRRQVKILDGDEDSDSMTYSVEYVFENSKASSDVRLYFIESFSSLQYFQIRNISTSDNNSNASDLVSYGKDLRGLMVIPRQHDQKTISYNLITYKAKPAVNAPQQ